LFCPITRQSAAQLLHFLFHISAPVLLFIPMRIQGGTHCYCSVFPQMLQTNLSGLYTCSTILYRSLPAPLSCFSLSRSIHFSYTLPVNESFHHFTTTPLLLYHFHFSFPPSPSVHRTVVSLAYVDTGRQLATGISHADTLSSYFFLHSCICFLPICLPASPASHFLFHPVS
jgi:hypothetical protein